MLDLDPHLLRAFLSVARIGTINGAAASLCRTQAAVSMQIRRLEEVVGSPLFVRSAKGLVLNDQGTFLVRYANDILALNEEVGKRIGQQSLKGRVKLGVVEDFAATRLIDILRLFRTQHPLVQLDLIVEDNSHLEALFSQRKLDLAICDVDVMQHKSGTVGREPLVTWPEQLTWTVHSDFDDARVETLPVILFEEGCHWRTRAVQALNERQVNWSLVCEATTLVAMATAVQVGLGVGPMITATIPPGCRSIHYLPHFPNPIALDIGLYVHNATSESAHCLADFVLRSPGNIFAAR
ncbi:LysR substrate-binding domain-containing protein [Rhodoferax sp.]|uniref:LysR substrate-binding domain-containing protein n=1 Tax=Rhodoferax sp. TaxID=50421 RepID=UPI0025DAD45B|nr:LysR substrate-binding domain-containing protein [Rhodoferax sp.]